MPAVSPAVLAVCRSSCAEVDLVVHHIYSFLDVTARWTLATAAAAGHVHLVQRLSPRTPPNAHDARIAMDQAAKHGHLHIVQWLHAHRDEGCSDAALVDASYAGHAHVVQWLLLFRREGRVGDAIASAAMGGHEELVEWLLSHTHLRDCSRPLAPMIPTKPPVVHIDGHWVAIVERALVL